MPTITVRRTRSADRAAVIAVEAKSTPGLRYLPQVFDRFLADERGEFLVAEIAGEVVACGKFTVVPDGSAWLETLRVIPERQGLGIGKQFYERFFAIAQREGVTTMRMYTGTKNLVSKGLAERFGFQPVGTFYGAWRTCDPRVVADELQAFPPLTDPEWATARLLAHREAWHDFLVMNRTFCTLTPAFCRALTRAGQVYEEPTSGSVIVLGARFMPEQALHIGLFGGDVESALHFAMQQGTALGVPRVSCLFPTAATETKESLTAAGFQLEPAEFIVMAVNL